MSPSPGTDYPSPRENPPKPIPPKPNFNHNALFETQLTHPINFKLPAPKRNKTTPAPVIAPWPPPRHPEEILQEIQTLTRNITATDTHPRTNSPTDCPLPSQMSSADKYTLEGKQNTADALSLPALTTLSQTINTPPANTDDINIASLSGTYLTTTH
jgi:hypothetical protein